MSEDRRIFGEKSLESRVVWFAQDLLFDLTLATLNGIEIDDRDAGHWVRAAQGLPCDHQCVAGILMKARGRVWRLTGEYDARYGGYEGRWPD
jgi:hypothetical protein